MSICIICIYLLHPFGNQITEAFHRCSHVFLEIVNHPDDHQHSSNFISGKDHLWLSAAGLSSGHEHPVISFLSAAFNFQDSMPDSQTKISPNLDVHLLSEVGNFSLLRDFKSFKQYTIPHKAVIDQYYDRHTPPPRTPAFLG